MRRTAALLATALVTIGCACAHPDHHHAMRAPAVAPGVSVPLDEVRVVMFARPVATVYVGNPVIADVKMIDTRRAFIQGKSYGVTNVIALDDAGRQISNSRVVVAGGQTSTVTLLRGTAQTTYACAGARCEVSPQPGDGKDSFNETMDQVAKHQALIVRTAAGQAQ